MVLHRDVTTEHHRVGQNGSVADLAIVGDVDIGHEQIVVPDPGAPPSLPRPAMNGDELTEDVALTDGERRALSPELRVLGNQADRRERKHLRVVADLGPSVDDRGRPDEAPPPDPHVRTDQGIGSHHRPGPDQGSRGHPRGAIDACFIEHQPHQQLRLGDHVLTYVGHRRRHRHPPAAAANRHFEAQAVARHHLAAEPRTVDAAEHRAQGRGLAVRLEQQHPGGLGEHLDHQHPGHDRIARKVPLEELLVDGDVLDGDEPHPRLVLDDVVEQHGGIAEAEAVEEPVESVENPGGGR